MNHPGIKKYILGAASVLILVIIFIASPAEAKASLFDDFLSEMNKTIQGGVDGVKNLVKSSTTDFQSKALSLESTIELAPGGDVNKNNQVDAGDMIIFFYTINNPTDKKYTYATLKTNIQRNQLNSIDLVEGSTGLKDDGKTIEFPNLRIDPESSSSISFSGRVNYFTDNDPVITTEPELETEDKKSLYKGARQQKQARKIKKEDIQNKSKITKKDRK